MEVIDKLRDDNEYYNGVGKNYLSNSDIGTLLKNPRLFGQKKEDNKNFLFGRYFHQLILEPEKAEDVQWVDVSSRNTKAYKEFLAENDISVALLSSEKSEAELLVSKIKQNVDIFDMIYSADEFEMPGTTELHGLPWKGKADIVGSEFLYDLKTSSSIDRFKWSVRDYNYDSQAYIYQHIFGKPLRFIVIDKDTHMMGVYSVSDDSLERGAEKVERAVEVYNKFFSENATDNISQFYYKNEV